MAMEGLEPKSPGGCGISVEVIVWEAEGAVATP